jgi:hypothetical protein
VWESWNSSVNGAADDSTLGGGIQSLFGSHWTCLGPDEVKLWGTFQRVLPIAEYWLAS